MTERLLECEHLMNIINAHFKIDILTKCQKREYVDARMIFSKILKEKGHGPSFIAGLLKKNHASIINYLKKVDWYIKTDESLKKSYKECRESFYESHDPIFEFNKLELKHEVLKLRRALEIQIDKNNELRAERKRLDPLFKIVRERTKLDTEEEVSKRLIRMFNGVYG